VCDAYEINDFSTFLVDTCDAQQRIDLKMLNDHLKLLFKSSAL